MHLLCSRNFFQCPPLGTLLHFTLGFLWKRLKLAFASLATYYVRSAREPTGACTYQKWPTQHKDDGRAVALIFSLARRPRSHRDEEDYEPHAALLSPFAPVIASPRVVIRPVRSTIELDTLKTCLMSHLSKIGLDRTENSLGRPRPGSEFRQQSRSWSDTGLRYWFRCARPIFDWRCDMRTCLLLSCLSKIS